MSVRWRPEDRSIVEAGILDHPARSGRCAALARIVYRVAKPHDPSARGLHVRPRSAARFVLHKPSGLPAWGSHTLTETQTHAVDALTGADGHPTEGYLVACFHFPNRIILEPIDVFSVDPGIQEDP